ncbi:MAG TPA: glycoside hydrolase family 43 protein [Rhodanobacteraceae bacterium]
MASCAGAADAVHFRWFKYQGHDTRFAQPLPKGHYRNPILAGFHPDPSVVRVGDRFYLVNSTFAWFPGIPVYESRDLVHWRQIGHAIQRASQIDYAGLGVSRGIFAPDISFHDGKFYVVTTAMDAGGLFLVTADNPAGPWSQPTWFGKIKNVIDPSLFFDDNGKAYIVYNGPPKGRPAYKGERAIWMQAFDVAHDRLVGPRKMVLDGGVPVPGYPHPVWVEGPHLYKHHGWYYLMCAEGGTSLQHSEVVLRSRSPWGPFKAYAHNPILTQRNLPADRPHPVINAGHADLVSGPDGSWWAVFLASRAYGKTHFNTGRETFLLPVHWHAGWPTILAPGKVVPMQAPAPAFMHSQASQAPLTGNIVWRDDFNAPTIGPGWMTLRAPASRWYDLTSRPGSLTIHPLPYRLDGGHSPSLLARRQQNLRFSASTALTIPVHAGVVAGMVAFQNENHWYFLGVRNVHGRAEVFLQKRDGKTTTTVAKALIDASGPLELKMRGELGDYSFAYRPHGAAWHRLGRDEDGTILSTDVAGGFVGTMIGLYARTGEKHP